MEIGACVQSAPAECRLRKRWFRPSGLPESEPTAVEDFCRLGGGFSNFGGRIELVEQLGAETLHYLGIGNGLPTLTIRSPLAHAVRRGDEVGLNVDRSKLHCFDPAGIAIGNHVNRRDERTPSPTETIQIEEDK
jgi:hypothetical protein